MDAQAKKAGAAQAEKRKRGPDEGVKVELKMEYFTDDYGEEDGDHEDWEGGLSDSDDEEKDEKKPRLTDSDDEEKDERLWDDTKVKVVLPTRAYEISCAVKEREAPFACGGWAQVCAPIWLSHKHKGELELPSSSDAVAKFASHCSKAAPGYGLDSKDFATDFHPLSLGIIEKVEQVLKPKMKLVAKLDKLRIYGVGDFCKDDTPGSSTGLMATLMVVLPSPYTGGEIVTSRGGEEHVFNYSNVSDPSKVHWVCYSSDCEYEVKEIKSGFQVTLTYSLYSGHPTEAVVDSFPMELHQMFSEALQSREFFENGALLGFPCQHMLSRPPEDAAWNAGVSSVRKLVPLLKGSDAELYHAARNAGLKAQVRPVWQGYYVGRKVRGLEVCNEGTSGYSDENMYASFLEKCSKKNIVWCHDKGHWESGYATFSFDEKRGDVYYLNRLIAILVEVPPWKTREASKLELLKKI